MLRQGGAKGRIKCLLLYLPLMRFTSLSDGGISFPAKHGLANHFNVDIQITLNLFLLFTPDSLLTSPSLVAFNNFCMLGTPNIQLPNHCLYLEGPSSSQASHVHKTCSSLPISTNSNFIFLIAQTKI